MEDFENILKKAQKGDEQAFNDLLYEYLPLINRLVYRYGIKGYEDDLKGHLMFKFIENLKKFKIYRKN